jgi:hypothetical protein
MCLQLRLYCERLHDQVVSRRNSQTVTAMSSTYGTRSQPPLIHPAERGGWDNL